MRVKKFNYEGKKIIQIYITNVEKTDIKTLNKIEELKKEYDNNVVIFISGTMETIPQLKNMVMYQKELLKT